MHKSTRCKGFFSSMVALLVLDNDDDDDDSADSAKADADAKSTSATTKIRSVGGSGEEETLAVVAGGMCGNCKSANC